MLPFDCVAKWSDSFPKGPSAESRNKGRTNGRATPRTADVVANPRQLFNPCAVCDSIRGLLRSFDSCHRDRVLRDRHLSLRGPTVNGQPRRPAG